MVCLSQSQSCWVAGKRLPLVCSVVRRRARRRTRRGLAITTVSYMMQRMFRLFGVLRIGNGGGGGSSNDCCSVPDDSMVAAFSERTNTSFANKHFLLRPNGT